MAARTTGVSTKFQVLVSLNLLDIRVASGRMDDSQRVGARIASARKQLGLTQQQLADRAGVSKSMLSKVESGHASPSNAFVGHCAKALGVDVTYLSGQPHSPGTANTAVHTLIPGVRRALAAWDLGAIEDRPLTSLDALRGEVTQLHEWRHATAYDRIGAAVPGVLERLTIAAESATSEHEREQTFGLLTFAYRAANTVAHKLGYVDLSLTALDRMEWAVAQAGDPLLSAIVDYVRAGALSRIGEHDGAVRLLLRAIAQVEPLVASDPKARAVLGCLHMKAVAIYGSAADHDAVDTHLSEAERLSADMDSDAIVYETVFGPNNVALHALSAQVDMSRPAAALQAAERVSINDGSVRERTTYYWTDLARAYLLNAQPDRAIEALYEARAAAPLHFANSAVVRGAIYTAASQQRRASSGIRPLALSAGIQD